MGDGIAIIGGRGRRHLRRRTVELDRGVGRIALATVQIWRRGVEKVLAMRVDVAEDRADATRRLIGALHAAD